MTLPIEDALVQWLDDKVSITALLPSVRHIRTGLNPEGGSKPYIRIVLVDLEQLYHAGGVKAFAEARIRIEVHGNKITLTRQIADRIRQEFNTFLRGTMTTVVIKGVFITSIDKMTDRVKGGKEITDVGHSMDLTILHEQQNL